MKKEECIWRLQKIYKELSEDDYQEIIDIAEVMGLSKKVKSLVKVKDLKKKELRHIDPLYPRYEELKTLLNNKESFVYLNDHKELTLATSYIVHNLIEELINSINESTNIKVI